MSERKAITKEVARKYKKTKKGRRSMKKEEGIMEEHPPLIPPIKGGKIPPPLSPSTGEIKVREKE